MYKVTLKEMIAIVNNGAHPYKVTLSVIGDEGTLVAAAEDSNDIYTTQITNLKETGRQECIRYYSSTEGFSIISGNGLVMELWWRDSFWLPMQRKTGELI